MTTIAVTSGQTSSGVSLLSGDVMAISGGGYATDTTIDGGLQRVSSGGYSMSALVSDGGAEVVLAHGGAGQAQVGSGGVVRVSSGGAASGTEVDAGGRIIILGGGYDEAARLSRGGVEYDFGYTDQTVIGAGAQEFVERGGTAEAAVLKTGGRQIVVSGGMANNTVLSGGTLIVSAGGSICGGGIVIHAGKAVIAGDIAVWNTVRFAGAGAGTVELDNLAGFAATIAGFKTAKQKIDLGGFAFAAGETLGWTQSGTSGTLTVDDGAMHASLNLIGAYTSGDFQLADDGHGGTVITQATAALDAARLAQSMAAMLGHGRGANAGREAALAQIAEPVLSAFRTSAG